MSPTSSNTIGRREFFKAGAIAAAGMGCFTFGGLKEALAQAKAVGKPLLTEQSLNALVPAKAPVGAARKEFVQLAKEARADLKAFIRMRFVLTRVQEQFLHALSDRDLAAINKAIEGALEKGSKFQVKFLTQAQPPGSAKPKPGPAGDPGKDKKPGDSEGTPVTVGVEGGYNDGGWYGKVSATFTCPTKRE